MTLEYVAYVLRLPGVSAGRWAVFRPWLVRLAETKVRLHGSRRESFHAAEATDEGERDATQTEVKPLLDLVYETLVTPASPGGC
jgi:hypothetical protein